MPTPVRTNSRVVRKSLIANSSSMPFMTDEP
jgi:hypothetical protein